jgi:long-chain acyl-CoA synthetase
VCNKKSVKTLLDKINDMPSLKVIVYTNDYVVPDDTTIEMPNPPKGVKVCSFDEFVEEGDVKKYAPVPPSPSSTAVIMYTSGSTGKPKGVVITHANVTASVADPEFVLDMLPTDRYIAYLPLAHILEMVVEFFVISTGASLGYCDPKTMKEALGIYKPTHMVGVPKIWDTIRKGVLGKIQAAGPLQQTIAETGMEWKAFCLSIGLDTPLFNALLFDKLKAAVGGELKWALSGGGPLGGDTQIFARVAFGFPLVQAYGLTESTAVVCLQCAEDIRSGIQGVVLPSIEVKLESTPEITDKGGIPYMSTDRQDVDGNPCNGRGEILIKGPNVSIGYYAQPEKTKEVYFEDGWFATGDIGQFNEDGTLSIVDRKKNLVKLNGGEYVALEKMEIVYSNSNFVDALAGGVCVYADGDMDRPVALVELDKKEATKWAKEHGVTDDVDKLKDNEYLNKAVLASLQAEHANSDLSRIEKIVGVVLLTEPWTVENGCLTAANKLQRRNVLSEFPKEFEEMKQKGIFK